MVEQSKVRRRFLVGHGVLMLCLGMALFSLGAVMANPAFGDFGYAAAVTLTTLCLVTSAANIKIPANDAGQSRPVIVSLLITAGSIACWTILWMIQSSPTDICLLVLLAGLHGIFWGYWYVRLAFHFQGHPIKSAVLCVLAATTSALGIILATQSEISKLTAVTAVACYTLLVGAQILLTATFLFRECQAEEIQSGKSLEETEPNMAEGAQIAVIHGIQVHIRAEENRLSAAAD